MSKFWMKALFVVIAASLAAAPQVSATVPSPKPEAQARTKVFAISQGVTAPELLPFDLGPFPSKKCKKKVDGKVVLSVIVDAAGQPRNIMFLRPFGSDLDKFALEIVGADRFVPGTHDGLTAAVAESVEVGLQSCLEESEDDGGKKGYSLRLRAQPTQKFEAPSQPPQDAVLTSGPTWTGFLGGDPFTERVGGRVSEPVPLFDPEAQYTIEARKARITGMCVVSLIVDRQGMPQNIRMLKKLDPGLDQNAMGAVGRYRFKPAMRDGEPVPVIITVEVNFQLY